MTAVLEAPVTQETTGQKHPVHWCCVNQRDVPYFGLCGDLPVKQQRSGRLRIDCSRCLELIDDHTAICGGCLPFAGRYR